MKELVVGQVPLYSTNQKQVFYGHFRFLSKIFNDTS